MTPNLDVQVRDVQSAGRWLVIYNPTAGRRRRRKLDAALAVLRARGVEVRLAETAGPDDPEAMARDAEDDVSLVVVAGGDGTIKGAVEGLVARGAAGRTVPPLGVLPLGTANVLAGELGLPADAADAAGVLADGVTADIHLGYADGRCFLIMVGVGFDASVVARIRPSMKRLLGKAAYVVEALRELARPQDRRHRVTVGGETFEAAAIVLANGHFYGGRFVLAPNASLTAPEFQVCLFLRSGRWSVMRYFVAIALGLPGRWGGATHVAAAALGLLPRPEDYRVVPATEVTITGPQGSPVQGDGDIIGTLPMTAGIAPQTLKIIVPAGSSIVRMAV